jgi:hypothetical protein
MNSSEGLHIILFQGFSPVLDKLSLPVLKLDSVPNQSGFVNLQKIVKSEQSRWIFILLWIAQIFVNVCLEYLIVIK